MFCRIKSYSGFSLLETVLGLAILSIIIVTLVSLINFTSKLIYETKAKTIATALVNEKMEIVHNLPYLQIGTQGGIPQGSLPQTETITRNDIEFTIETAVIFIDDPFDGTLEGNPPDTAPADYKRVRIEVSWPFRLTNKPVVFISDIAPKGLESEAAGGTIKISVFNASGQPVPQANVHIENNQLSPAINLDILTDDNGLITLPGAPPSVEAYQVTVTKDGYSTAQTYSVDPLNLPTPQPPHLSVFEGKLTAASFAIDWLSSMTVFAFAQNQYNPVWWDENWHIRRRLTIINNANKTLPAGYSVKFNFDHYNQVQQGDALASGDDVRILWWNGVSWQELDRVNGTPWNNPDQETEIWFQIQAPIASLSSDDNYFIYYANPAAGPPPANPHQVYQFWDDFSDPNFTYANWSTTTNTWLVDNGEYHQTANTGETVAYAGPVMSDFLLEADVRSSNQTTNLSLLSRFSDSSNYYLGRPDNTPTTPAQVQWSGGLGWRSFVKTSDGTLAQFTYGTTGEAYRLYVSRDNGVTWNIEHSFPAVLVDKHSAWIEENNDIYFVYRRYVAPTDDYQLFLRKYTYATSTQSWTPGDEKAVIAAGYPYQPSVGTVLKHNNRIWVTYARLRDDGSGREIVIRYSDDEGTSWSGEIWLTNLHLTYSNRQFGELILWNNQPTVILSDSNWLGWRTFNGVNWSDFEYITPYSGFHNYAFSTAVTGISPNQIIHVVNRHSSTGGQIRYFTQDGTGWVEHSPIPTVNIAYDLELFTDGTKMWLFYKYPDDRYATVKTGQLYYKVYDGNNWESGETLIYNEILPINEWVTPRFESNPNYLYINFTVGTGYPNLYLKTHRIAIGGNGAVKPVAEKNVNGIVTPLSSGEANLDTAITYNLRWIVEDNKLLLYNNQSLIFSGSDSSFSQGRLGLYSNNTESYFDNVLARLYVSPEPLVTGDLEEEFSLSQPLAGLPFTLQGSKIIGYDSNNLPVPKYQVEHTTDSSGRVDINPLEWDSYFITVNATSTGYDISAIDPPEPVNLLPDSYQQVNLYLVADETHTLRVVVLDVNNQPIENATVRLYNTSLNYDETLTTPSYGQVFFSPLQAATYNISVSKTGYLPFSDQVDVDNYTVSTVTLIE